MSQTTKSWPKSQCELGFSLSLFSVFHVIQGRLNDVEISVWSTGCCQTPCANTNLTGLLQLMALNYILAGENISGLRFLHSTIYIGNALYY